MSQDASMAGALSGLWPQPRHLRVLGASAGLATLEPRVRIERAAGLREQGYRLRAADGAVSVAAADPAGARHALDTLAQLARRCGSAAAVPAFEIEDWPDFPVRGVLLDVSRGRVPRMDALQALVARLAAWRFNQLQLYVEHAFAYRGHEVVWRDASPLTPDEVRALDGWCAAAGIELVPNQQSLGHMHRWLRHARYRDLAEVPEGVEHAFSLEKEPFSLCLDDPRAVALLEDLYDQLLPCCASRQMNVGLDETFDLGLGRSRERCTREGVGRVYLDRLRCVHALARARGRRMQFWGDVIVQHPELVPELPRDAIALEWGYEAGHPFAEHLAQFARSGLEFWVCPGTSSWQSFAGRVQNMLANLREAARAGRDAGARGLLVTDWGDRGHHQPHAVRELGLLAAAGLAWNASTALDAATLATWLVEQAGWNAALARAALELGDAYLATGSPATNGSALFFLVAFAPDAFPHPRTPNLNVEGLRAARAVAERAVGHLTTTGAVRADAEQLQAEIAWASQALVLAADLGLARLAAGEGVPLGALPRTERSDLAARFTDLATHHRDLWLARDREGGLSESLRWFERVRAPLAAP